MSSTLALIGGGEFRPGNEQVDRYLIERAGGAVKARGIIIPTAAAREHPEIAVRNGERWFHSLGVTMDRVMIVDRESAENPKFVAALDQANFYYLLGGDPRLLLDTLRDTSAWRAIERKYRAGEAVLAGSSAGAMVLAAWMTDFHGGFFPALDVAPTPCAVAPHFTSASLARILWQNLPAGARLLGLTETTGAVFDGQDWQAIGPGTVAVIERTGESRSFKQGEHFQM